MGVDTLAAAVGEERDTIEDVYEPFLIQEGFLVRTPKWPDGDPPGVRPSSAVPPVRPSHVTAQQKLL